MFRQEEVFIGGWHEKTIEAMQRRRFETMVARLSPLGSQRIDALSSDALRRRIESSWQEVEIKPLRSQQIVQVKKSILNSIELHADCLSQGEHDLVERALILGGTAMIEDAAELEAAQALSYRLWASVGLVSGRPYMELEPALMRPVAKALASDRHEQVRRRFEEFRAHLYGMLYRFGALDDRQPQQMILQEVLEGKATTQSERMLARCYLWSSCDCMDYGSGVMLLHPALAEPQTLLSSGKRWRSLKRAESLSIMPDMDILPEEIPLQEGLERVITGVMRDGHREREVARNLRFLCKQGAPLPALQEILQSSLIVLLSRPMHCALENMYYMTPKWIECAKLDALQ